jgi:hypothetical protein
VLVELEQVGTQRVTHVKELPATSPARRCDSECPPLAPDRAIRGRRYAWQPELSDPHQRNQQVIWFHAPMGSFHPRAASDTRSPAARYWLANAVMKWLFFSGYRDANLMRALRSTLLVAGRCGARECSPRCWGPSSAQRTDFTRCARRVEQDLAAACTVVPFRCRGVLVGLTGGAVHSCGADRDQFAVS